MKRDQRTWLLIGGAVLIVGLLVVVLAGIARRGALRPVGLGPERTEPGRYFIFPLIFVSPAEPPATPWRWPAYGIGVPTQYPVDTTALFAERDYWYYDWSPRCLDRQVPMVWRDVTSALWACNDGRPLLVLNEPDYVGQANLTPAQVAARLYEVRHWRGEIYCCGTAAHHLAYIAAVIDAYQAQYGAWPAAGWHVHGYSNRAVWVKDIPDVKYVPGALADLDAFIAYVRGRGLLGRGVVVSEYGVLSRKDWHIPAELVPAFRAYRAGLAQRPAVLATAWFSTYYLPLSASDLLYQDGRLTALGIEWRR